MAVLLALVTVGLYWPAMRCDFVDYDDSAYVTENLHVQGGLTWAGIKWALSNPVAANWHPLTLLSHMLDCQLFRLNPWGHHLTSVLLHAINTALVFLLLFQMTGLRGNKSPILSSLSPRPDTGSKTAAATASARQAGALWRSAMVAGLFGWHPVHVESVAWVSERKDVLSTFFGLLSLLFYVCYVKKSKVQSPKSKVFYGLTLIFLALGLMCKAMLVTWPLVMLLLDYWPLGRMAGVRSKESESDVRLTRQPSTLNPLARRSEAKTAQLSTLFLEKLPFFGLAVAASVVTFVVQKQSGAVTSIANLPLSGRIENSLISYCRYLGKMFWPVDLAVFYPHLGPWPVKEVLLAGGLILGITVLCIMVRRRYPFMLMGWLWYVGTLVPVIGLVQVSDQAMADRYTYIPSLGVLILVIWGAYELTCRWRYRAMILSVAGGVAIVLCLGMTRRQLGYWQDSEALFRHALDVTKNNYFAHKALGLALGVKGQTDEAISQFQKALRLKPDFVEAHYALGIAFNQRGRTDEAINQFQEAIRLVPDDAQAHYALGIVFDQKNRTEEAIQQFRIAIRLKPDFAQARYNLGNVLCMKGQIDEAIKQYREAIRSTPDDATIHNNFGVALVRKNQTDEAIRQYREAIRLNPDFADAHNNLGSVLYRTGQTDEAISQFQEVIRLNPDSAEAHNVLGFVLGMKGRTDEAISQFQEAIRLKPDFAEARNNLAHALQIKKNAPTGQ
jgi:tetratricopeptide (TPR) repeat protein